MWEDAHTENQYPKAKAKVAATTFVCGPQCKNGEEHDWSGPVVKLPNGGSSSCAKCGVLAIDASMWH